MAAVHRHPEHKWTVQALADEAHVSPSLLDERFRQRLGLAPIRYLTGWRMHVAEELLSSTDLGVAAVARRVGYEAEEAFSRAFKRSRGMAPRAWRDQHGASVNRSNHLNRARSEVDLPGSRPGTPTLTPRSRGKPVQVRR